MPPNKPTPVTILFLCWGYSIHAQRRIKIFCDDSRFRVVVVSPHHYHFDNAVNVHLGGAGKYDNLNGLTGLWNWIRLLKAVIPAYFVLRKTYRRYHPDVIFQHTLMYPCYLAYGLPTSTPRIITFWNGDLIWWAKWNGLERSFKKWLVTHGIRQARAITVNSDAALERCVEYGVKRNTIHLIRYPGVDMEFFKPMEKQAARKQLGITAKHVLLWPRGLGGYLNSDVLLEAAPIILKRFPDTLFVVLSKVGGELVPQYQRQLAQMKIAQHFRFKLQVEHALMPVYYGACDGVISLSSNDSLPNILLESYACLRAPIMADLPQLREWVNHAPLGSLVPPRDSVAVAGACIALLDPKNARTYARYAERGRQKVLQDANSAVTVPAIKQLVLNVIQQNRQKHGA